MNKSLIKDIQHLCSHRELKGIKKLICGKKIGSGVYRDVYVLKQDDNYVVKIERNMNTGTFANVTEWRNWINNKDWEYIKDWLAPIELINTTGNIMIQKRVSLEGKTLEDFPKEIPALFTDTKITNFGWINDKFVCCDYSFFTTIIGSKKYKRAKWTGLIN
jgi:hypothetical protein